MTGLDDMPPLSSGSKHRRRTAASPPKYHSTVESESPQHKQRHKHIWKNRLRSLLPDGLLRPYWWIYVVLIVIGIVAARLSSSSTTEASTASSITTTAATNDAVIPIINNTAPALTKASAVKTLALLYPPGLFGGYRNQVIRLTAFVVYAMKNGYKQILLSSLIWNTKFDGSDDWVPVPHELLFDVELWNSILGDDLPRLVRYSRSKMPDWEIPYDRSHKDPLVEKVLIKGFSTPILDYASEVVRGNIVMNPHKVDLYANVSQCTSPAVYGGGTFAGRLWNDYININNKLDERHEFPFGADAKIVQALQPRQEFRELAKQCVRDGTLTKDQQNKPFVALHARIELEMMAHKCGRTMEKNLTHIFEMVDGLVKNDLADQHIEGVFIAVSRSGIEEKEGPRYQKYQNYADENLKTLDRVVGTSTTPGSGLQKGAVPVFECGRPAVQRFYEAYPEQLNLGTLLESIVNFHIATEATAFVGVRGSSYSTDIWTTRYHLGKGHTNYEYTLNGIKLIDNGGLPPAHTNC